MSPHKVSSLILCSGNYFIEGRPYKNKGGAMTVVGETKIDTGDKFAPIVDYNLKYTSSKSEPPACRAISVAELTGKYVNILWDDDHTSIM